MQLSALRPIYDAETPIATVYLQSQSPTPEAEHEVTLRWRSLRTQLADAGAHQETLDALDEALSGEQITAVQTEGRVLVANRDGLLLEEDFDATIDGGDRAILGEPAQLGDYLRQRVRSVRALVVLTDQERATIRRLVLTSDEVHASEPESSVEGSAVESVHKPRGGALKHRTIQNTADEAAQQNIRDVVQRVERIARRWKPDLVVIAGEVQGRRLLHEELPVALQEIAQEVDAGGGIAGGSADERAEEGLNEELSGLARRVTIERARELTEAFAHAQAHNLAVEGAENVRRAITLGAVETILLRYNTPAEAEEELLQAAAGVDAAVGLVGTDVSDNVAAILRFEAPVEQLEAHPRG